MKLFLNNADSIYGSRYSCGRGFWENLIIYYFFVWEAVDVGSDSH